MEYGNNYLALIKALRSNREREGGRPVSKKEAGGLGSRIERSPLTIEREEFDPMAYMRDIDSFIDDDLTESDLAPAESLRPKARPGSEEAPGLDEGVSLRPQTLDDVIYKKTYLDESSVDYEKVARGLKEAADELGMSVEDLATIVSYETAGTFNPVQPGPKTKFGQHKGFIQFGEPQAEQFGIDWNDPYDTQLGADGAIVKYFRDRGFEEGMGLMDAYSIVNTGGPGRYDWSDEGAGGAPGTVRDKVTKQMSGHKAKARRLIEEYL